MVILWRRPKIRSDRNHVRPKARVKIPNTNFLNAKNFLSGIALCRPGMTAPAAGARSFLAYELTQAEGAQRKGRLSKVQS